MLTSKTKNYLKLSLSLWKRGDRSNYTDSRCQTPAQRLAADGSYGTGPFLSWLMERGVEPHVPVLERKH